MGSETAIEWADATINLWWGCTKVSPGCKNCYAERLAHRWGKDCWGPGAPREDHRAAASMLAMRLNRKAKQDGRTIRVFSASQSDWLDPEVPAEWLASLLALIAATPHLTWMLLSKRPELWRTRIERALDFASECELPGPDEDGVPRGCDQWVQMATLWLAGGCPTNVWVGTTVEDQARADQRIPDLLAIPAQVRLLSCEPLLERVDVSLWLSDPAEPFRVGLRNGSVTHAAHPFSCACGCRESQRRIGWVICGGESGPGARPMHPEWARSLRDQCQAAGVPFFFKQWGAWCPGDQVDELVLRSKKQAGRLLDGRTWDELPA